MPVHTLTAGGSWVTANDEVHMVVAQVERPSNATLLADASRPSVVRTITELLGPNLRLGQIITGSSPTIIILPELALSFSDWAAVDELVRAQARQLILIAGFGFTSGSKLTEWAIASQGTHRSGAWEANAAPGSERIYNGGWCWIHRPGHVTQCVAFLKRTAEQSHEIQVPNLAFGDRALCIELDDLIIFPVICADLLNVQQGERVAGREITDYLHAKPADARKVLVAGLLLQDKPHGEWRAAITEIARLNVNRINVCLANCANSFVAYVEETDRWRDYSGVFLANGRNANRDHFGNVRRFTTDQIDAAVVRATSPLIIGGPLRWTFSMLGRHIWANPKDYGLAADGMLLNSPCSDTYVFEALRMLKRITTAPDSAASMKTAFSLTAFKSVEAQIMAATDPKVQTIYEKVILGEKSGGPGTVSADTLPDYILPLAVGLRAIGALKSCNGAQWQSDAKKIGQLHTPEARILVWANPGDAITVRSRLNSWRANAERLEPTLVFTKSFGASFPVPDKASERRRDIGDSPAPTTRSAAEAAQLNLIEEIALDEIDMCLGAGDAVKIQAAISNQITKGVQKVAAQGSAP